MRFLAFVVMVGLVSSWAWGQSSSRRARQRTEPAREKGATTATLPQSLMGVMPPSQEPAAGALSKSAATGTAKGDQASTSARALLMQDAPTSSVLAAAVREWKLEQQPDIRVGYGFTGPSPYYDFDGSTLAWKEPLMQNSHYLVVALHDAATGREIHGCKVTATVADGTGKDVPTSVTLEETWDAYYPHYGANVSLQPTLTTGTITVKASPPVMRRRDQVLGAFFASPLTTTFSNVDLSTATLPQISTVHEKEPKAIWPAGRRPYTLGRSARKGAQAAD